MGEIEDIGRERRGDGVNCPVDGELLQMTERQGVEIDYCPRCRGVWLDRGELDKILERASIELMPATPVGRERGRDYDDDDDDRDDRRPWHDDDRRERGLRRKKKGSFLSEMFEFGE